ncbi:MAG TPA: hypothetical protein VF000_09800 [Agromyces sp.]|jgi:predicted small secreted protein
MPTITARSRLAIAVVIAGTCASLLTACNPVDAVNQGVEEAIESATGGDVSVGELPEDFPDSVPLIEGDVSVGGAGGTSGADGWFVVVTSTAADPVADAIAALEAAGFTRDQSIAGEGASLYTNDEYTVLLLGRGEMVSYTVSPKS